MNIKRIPLYRIDFVRQVVNAYLKNKEDFKMCDYISEGTEIKDFYKLHCAAIKLYSKDKCFLCGRNVDWENSERADYNGRMLNTENSNMLDPSHWVTACSVCYKKIKLEEMLNEGFVKY